MTMLCRFETTALDDGRFLHKCKRTTCINEVVTERPKPPGMNCKGLPETTRVFNFTVAAIGHLMRGCPSCTQEEIDARLVVCRQCPLHKAINESLGYCTHKSCGCSITDMRGFVNKLGWRDQRCPDGRWPALPVVAVD